MDAIMIKGKEIPKEILLQGESGKVYTITVDLNGAVKATETAIAQAK